MTNETKRQAMTNDLIVNNTGEDLCMFHEYFLSVANKCDLPAEIADLFAVKVINVDGQCRVLVDWL